MRYRILFILLAGVLSTLTAFGQIGLNQSDQIDYQSPKDYEIGGITIKGTNYLDPNAIIQLSGLTVGDQITVPGDDVSGAIKKLWKQQLFSDIKINQVKTQGEIIFLEIEIKEQPRISRFKFKGVSKTEADNLRDDINLYKEKIITPALLVTTENQVKDYFIEKGYYNCQVNIESKSDSAFANHVMLTINVEKNKRFKIHHITVNGNKSFSEGKVKRTLKETKERAVFTPFYGFDTLIVKSFKALFIEDSIILSDVWSDHLNRKMKLTFFKTSKYLEENFEKDKKELISKYNEKGYRDARVVSDSLYTIAPNRMNLILNLDEGNRYYFRDVSWTGNTKYTTHHLNQILGIAKGDVYNQKTLDTRLFMNPNGKDVSSLYMDDGYLFFQVTPVEIAIDGDSIDLEMRIYEGQQARINRVMVMGNTKTNDHVIMREIRTKPGQLFSRSDIIRTQRELSQLGYFDPEKLNVNPKPNPADGTVDIEYIVEEKPSDQIELSGGWGGGRIVGTLGVSFSNFSTRNFFKKGTWRPLPAGDGQRLSVRAQSNGAFFQSYNMSFTEPWLGGRKPNSLSVTAWHSIQSNGRTRFLKDTLNTDGEKVQNPDRYDITISGLSLGLGKRLTWPDDYFTLMQEVSFQNYTMNKWSSFIFSDGVANNLFYRVSFSRNSVSAPIYPRNGSQLTLSAQITPFYSYFNPQKFNNAELSDQDKYKWVEYHKWKFTSSWFTELAPKLVLNTRVGFGFLAHYNKDIGPAPFERFYLGGSGLTGFSLDGREIIALRGYDDQRVSPRTGGTIISKYTAELRYPISLNPQATIFALSFLEAGNTWDDFRDYTPFSVKRSGGFGVRIFLPMFGLLGLDWGYRFDDIPGINMQKHQVHFTIGANLGEL